MSQIALAIFVFCWATVALGESLEEIYKRAYAGDANSQFELGGRYLKGNGVKKNLVEAIKWFTKSADQGYVPAEGILGAIFFGGDGAARDLKQAVKWTRKGAEHGDAVALTNLGYAYSNGIGVTKDPVQAVALFRKAAEQNAEFAQYNLGCSYRDGSGVARDYSEAISWFRKAAEQNFPNAQYDLAISYSRGRGVPKNEVEAYKWWLLAAAQGSENANQAVAVAEGRLTREQIAEGQRLARNFRPREIRSGADASRPDVLPLGPTASGSAFFITEDGYLITNAHVVREANKVQLVTRAGILAAKVIKLDSADDLALLKAEGKFVALPIATSRAVQLGSMVATVGFPNITLQGFAPKFARGEVASLSGPQDDARYFQISLPVQPGNSGGPLVDERGNVIGVVSAKLSAKAALSETGALPENVNYAVKSSYILGFLEAVPDVIAKLGEQRSKQMKTEDLAEAAKNGVALVLVYEN